jgi:SAM-dependent methyltransferase
VHPSGGDVGRTFYTGGCYLEQHPSWHLEDSPWKAEQILRVLRRHRLEPRTVCEVGCGAGGVLRALHDTLGGDVAYVGLDVSEQALELAASRRTDRLRFELRDVVVDGVGGTFDLMLLVDIIEHVEDYFGFLRAVRPAAAYTILHIPLDLTAEAVLRPPTLLLKRRQDGHIHYFTKELALAALADAGYAVVDSFYTPVSVRHPPVSLVPRLGKLWRKALFRVNEDLAARSLGGYSLLVLAR